MEAGTVDRAAIDAAHSELDSDQFPPGAGDEPDGVEAPVVLQGTFDGEWEEIIGGQRPTARKVRLTGGAIEIADMPEIKKGETVVLEVRATCDGVTEKDIEDGKTQQVVGCNETRTLKIRGARVVG